MKINYHRIIFWLGFIIWFLGSWYGGWHKTATAALEGYTDSIGGILMLYGALGDILRGIKIFKDNTRNYNFPNVNKVVVQKKRPCSDVHPDLETDHGGH